MGKMVCFSRIDQFAGKLPAFFIVIIVSTIFPGGTTLLADAYQIGPEDVIEIKFWQDNSLDATVTVRQDGKISLDVIGEIEAAGLTTSELEKKIVRQMSRYNKSISQAVVRVVQYGHLKVFVSGQVPNPGKYSFEQIPDLWTLINEAGGVTDVGDLTRVTIIRGGDRAGEVEIVNVSALMASGRRGELPKIYSDDTIEIPRTIAGLPARTIGDQTDVRNLYYVIGEVVNPGAMNLEKNIDVLDAIALAGGPTERADLKNAKVISKDGFRTQTVKINLKKYLESGAPGRYFIRPEDTIILPRKGSGLLGMGSLTDIVTVLGAVSAALLLYDRLKTDDEAAAAR
ncbi:MAG: polysaccharide biosynthesis/export family protein [Candidatus Zixiibacteriota bacterium]|nr:MAG: polysaccharide biosynthesis/export family protein [candidate division Zixibacteria bacterium]